MTLQGPKTHELFEKALQHIPHGVNSNFRYWGDDDTLIIKRGEGAYIWDMDDKRYIDYRLAFGPVILGHADPRVTKRVQEAIEGGNLFAWTTPLEISVAERIKRLTGVDKVRLTNTGTEATFHALRIARAYTGREKFIKFEGQYHGMIDYFMFGTASSNESQLGLRTDPRSAAMSLGIPKGIGDYVLNLPYNDLERLEETLAQQSEEIAAIFVEPILGNAAGIMPQSGFLEGIRALCDQYGIVLVFDEVKTGFRIANGGAQEYFGIKADLATYAKSLGNGFPVAAIGGKEEIMMTVQPGAMAHGGTYSGNVAGVAAADATLEILENEPIIETINARGKALMEGIDEILTEQNIPHVVTGVPSMLGILLGTDQEPREFRDYIKGDAELYDKIGMALIERGIQPDSDGREPWFLCAALSEEDVAETLNVFNDAVKAVK
ncbi:MAG: aspartate aminotransferase family protein [Chloroflexi bacterium]|jgi:glutamate-1-semialdehyde 2,1-aminomutase|nr:aspartate aminotransferase family protein [Chloroflexota bacterium]